MHTKLRLEKAKGRNHVSEIELSVYSSVYPFLLLSLELRASVKRFVSLQFLNLRQSVGLLGRGSARPKAATYTQTDIHTLSGIRTHDLSVRTGEDVSFLRPRGH
jgi:hypothetical protein